MTAPAFFNTADRLIRMAMEDAGLLQDGQDPSSEQIAKNIQRLNDMINLWQTQGLKLWTYRDTTINLVQGQANYTFKPGGDIDMTKPLRGLQAYFLQPGGARQQLTVLSWDDYIRLSQVNQEGAINSYFVDKLYDQLKVFLWLVPDATAVLGTAHILLQTQVVNFEGVTDSTIFPPEWFIGLRWGLADEICTGQPMAIMERCERRALLYRTALEDWDVEDAPTQFQPDSRMQYTGNQFQ